MSRNLLFALFVACCASVVAPPALAAPPSNDSRARRRSWGSCPRSSGGRPRGHAGGGRAALRLRTDQGLRLVHFTAPRAGSCSWRSTPRATWTRARGVRPPAFAADAVTCMPTDRRGRATIDRIRRPARPISSASPPLAKSVDDAFSCASRSPRSPRDRRARRFRRPGRAGGGPLRQSRRCLVDAHARGPHLPDQPRDRRTRLCAGALYAEGEFGRGGRRACRATTTPCSLRRATGRYTLHVRAPRASRALLPYRLRVGPAERDDSAPGIVLPDDRRVRGRAWRQ